MSVQSDVWWGLMSVISDRGQEDGGVDLQEAKMSFPRLVRRQTANIPPGERTGADLSKCSIPGASYVFFTTSIFYLWQPIPFQYPFELPVPSVATHSKIPILMLISTDLWQSQGRAAGDRQPVEANWKTPGKWVITSRVGHSQFWVNCSAVPISN